MQESKQLPTFVINLAWNEPSWTPETWQMMPIVFKNRSYLNSLWLGTVWQLVLLPGYLRDAMQIAWYVGLLKGLSCLFVHIPAAILKRLVFGVLGRLNAVRLPQAILVESGFMNERAGLTAALSDDPTVVGHRALVTKVR